MHRGLYARTTSFARRRTPGANRGGWASARHGAENRASRDNGAVRYSAAASDYDGTLATDGALADSTAEALARVRESGRKLVLRQRLRARRSRARVPAP